MSYQQWSVAACLGCVNELMWSSENMPVPHILRTFGTQTKYLNVKLKIHQNSLWFLCKHDLFLTVLELNISNPRK